MVIVNKKLFTDIVFRLKMTLIYGGVKRVFGSSETETPSFGTDNELNIYYK